LANAFCGHTAPCISDDHWRTKYGMVGADFKRVANDLLFAAKNSTYVAPSISGIYLSIYNTYPYMLDRPWYVDAFFVYYWKAADRWQEILPAAQSIHIINRDWETLTRQLKGKYGLVHTKVTGFPINSWQDVDAARTSALQTKAELVLVSGGPPGKRLPADIAAAYRCVALDVGCGLEVCV